MAFYEPELWAKNNAISVEVIEQSLSRYGHLIKFFDRMKIMDVGIGDGNVSEFAFLKKIPKNFNFSYVATDVSNEMIEYAKKRPKFLKFNLGVLDITTGQLPLEYKEEFDLVTAFNVFHCIKNVRQALVNIYDMLQAGGQTYCVFFEWTPLDGAFFDVTKNPKWAKYRTDQWCSPFYKTGINVMDFYKKTMGDIGFKSFKINRDMFYCEQDPTTNKNFLISVNRAMKNVENDDLKDYTQDYFKCYLQQDVVTVSEDGEKIYAHLPSITIYAIK